MKREDIIPRVLQSLEAAGFEAFYCTPTHGCFDIAARRGQEIVLVKVLENIDAFTSIHSQDLQVVSKMLGARGFLVGAKSKEYQLGEGILYQRHGIATFSPQTFGQIIGGGEAHAKKFKRMMVPVDSQALKSARLGAGLSIENLAQKARLSADTVYRYEHSLTMATPKHIETLEEVLGVSNLAVPAMANLEAHKGALSSPHKFRFFGMESIHLSGPVDIVSKNKEERKQQLPDAKEEQILKKLRAIIAEKDRDARTLEKKADTFDGLAQILQSYSCFFVKKSTKSRIKNVPVITQGELAQIRNSEDLLELIGSKTKK